jgi:hypothetical protein
MYVKSVETLLTNRLQAAPEVAHSELLDGLTHQERLGLVDTIREMERAGKLKRTMQRNEAGKLVPVYVRVG